MTSTDIPMTRLLLFSALSASVISLPYEYSEVLIPEANPDFEYNLSSVDSDWRDNAFNRSTEYMLQDEKSDKIDAILGFSKKVIENSKDMDGEYVDIVNENFWDLI